MNWLSQEEIKRRAEESPEEALNVSIQGWEQKRDALKAGKSIFGHSGTDYCGLCYRYIGNSSFNCPKCFLDDGDTDKSCCPEWRNFSHKESLENIEAMLNRLYLERGKRYGKETKEVCKKEEPPAIRHGDYGHTKHRDARIIISESGELVNAGCSQLRMCGSLLESDGVLGNVFDDLKMYAEDLERFDVSDEDGVLAFEATKQYDCDLVFVEIHRKSHGFFNLEQCESIGKQLLQVAAYVRRQAKKEDC